MTTPRVLFLCTHNSARSQMAEAFLRTLADNQFDVASAGTEATRVHPLAIQAMREIGIDLAGQASKSLDGLLDKPWDYVITIGTEPERLQAFRRVRDQIHSRLRQWLKNLEEPAL